MLQDQIQAAQASGDIATLLKIIASTSELTVNDYIKKTVGSLLFLYYMFTEQFHVRPRDLNDLTDGLLYLKARGYREKREYEKLEDRMRSKNGLAR